MNLHDISTLTETQARAYLESLRWPHGPLCVHCRGTDVTRIAGHAPKVRAGLLRCKTCRKQFTVTVGTIFEDSHIPLRKWLLAVALMCSSKKGVSALQLQRALGLGSYKTAWHLAHRVRKAMTRGPLGGLLQGIVEADETYVGSKNQGPGGRRVVEKAPVLAMVERGGRVRTRVLRSVSAPSLHAALLDHVQGDARIMTDGFRSYHGLAGKFSGGHRVIQHGIGPYARGEVHTNTAESFFALFKRGLRGTYQHVAPKHLDRYGQEFGFRWDHRHATDAERTVAALKATEGKRLMYRQLRGTLPA